MDNITIELQEYLKKMFKEISNIFKENNINYFAVGGTLLGAIRHKGFIPWDDDIDIALLEEDYDNLILHADEILPNYYKLIYEEDSSTKYPYFHAKIYDTRTTLVTNSKRVVRGGIFIDVFQLFNAGNNLNEAEKNAVKVRGLVNKYSFIEGAYRKTFLRKILSLFFRIPLKILYPKKKIKNKIEKIIVENKHKPKYVAAFFGSWVEKDVYEKEWFNETENIEFEDFIIKVPIKYTDVLSRTYGDYMKLPDEKNRNTHHDFKEISFDKSYKGD